MDNKESTQEITIPRTEYMALALLAREMGHIPSRRNSQVVDALVNKLQSIDSLYTPSFFDSETNIVEVDFRKRFSQ